MQILLEVQSDEGFYESRQSEVQHVRNIGMIVYNMLADMPEELDGVQREDWVELQIRILR